MIEEQQDFTVSSSGSEQMDHHSHGPRQRSAGPVRSSWTPGAIVCIPRPTVTAFTDKQGVLHLLTRAVVIRKCSSTKETGGGGASAGLAVETFINMLMNNEDVFMVLMVLTAALPRGTSPPSAERSRMSVYSNSSGVQGSNWWRREGGRVRKEAWSKGRDTRLT